MKNKLILIKIIFLVTCLLCGCKKLNTYEYPVIGTVETTGLYKHVVRNANVKIAVLDTPPSIDDKNIKVLYGDIDERAFEKTHSDRMIEIIREFFPDIEIDIYVVADANGVVDNEKLEEALRIVCENKYDVINLSFCTKRSRVISELLNDCYKKGTVIVASAGNEGNSEVGYPACLDNVFSIGAINQTGELTAYSNSGRIDFVMPGEITLFDSEEKKVTLEGTSVSTILFSCVCVDIAEEKNIHGKEIVLEVVSRSENPWNNDKIGYGQPILCQ